MRGTVARILLAIGVVGLLASIALTVAGLRAVANIEDAVASAASSTRRTASSVDAVVDVVGDLSSFAESFGAPPLVTDDLRIDESTIDRTEDQVRTQLGRTRILVVGLGLVLAATQLVPLWLGWLLLDPARIRRVLELPDPPGQSRRT